MSLVGRVLDRVFESGSARARSAWPSGRMWAVAGLRASTGTAILFLAPYGASIPHLEHVLHTVGIVGISLAAYSLILHFEGHAMDAIIRGFEVALEWFTRRSPVVTLFPSSGVNGWWDDDNPPLR